MGIIDIENDPETLKERLEEIQADLTDVRKKFRAYAGMEECGYPCIPGEVRFGCPVHGRRLTVLPATETEDGKLEVEAKTCESCGTPIHMKGQTKCFDCLYPKGL